MKIISLTIAILLLSPLLLSCDRYKLVDTEKEKASQAQETIKKLEKKVHSLEKNSNEAKKTPGTTPAKPEGWIRLYEHGGFKGRQLTIRVGQNIRNMNRVTTKDGKKGFNDKASSVRHRIPEGWFVVLHQDDNFGSRRFTLKGNGSIADLGSFSDQASSVKWVRQ